MRGKYKVGNREERRRRIKRRTQYMYKEEGREWK